MEYGATFSHHELEYIKIDVIKAAKSYTDLNFKWVRLGFYWNESLINNNLNLLLLDKLIDYFSNKNINIILTFGMKAPRWPEYYIPQQIIDKDNLNQAKNLTLQHKHLTSSLSDALNFLLNHYQGSSIKMWQIENEPLDPSGPNKWTINPKLLDFEINLIKSIDPSRKTLINLWANQINSDYQQFFNQVDAVGLDLYPCQKTKESPQKIQELINKVKLKNDLWITELQAEPWENKHYSQLSSYTNFSPNHIYQNLKQANELNPQAILFWGFEFWLFQKLKGDKSYWDTLQKSLNTHPI